jgi:hypothetical protein
LVLARKLSAAHELNLLCETSDRQVYKNFDTDNNGTLEISELMELLGWLNEPVTTREEIEQLQQLAGDDGTFQFEEFVEACLSVKAWGQRSHAAKSDHEWQKMRANELQQMSFDQLFVHVIESNLADGHGSTCSHSRDQLAATKLAKLSKLTQDIEESMTRLRSQAKTKARSRREVAAAVHRLEQNRSRSVAALKDAASSAASSAARAKSAACCSTNGDKSEKGSPRGWEKARMMTRITSIDMMHESRSSKRALIDAIIHIEQRRKLAQFTARVLHISGLSSQWAEAMKYAEREREVDSAASSAISEADGALEERAVSSGSPLLRVFSQFGAVSDAAVHYRYDQAGQLTDSWALVAFAKVEGVAALLRFQGDGELLLSAPAVCAEIEWGSPTATLDTVPLGVARLAKDSTERDSATINVKCEAVNQLWELARASEGWRGLARAGEGDGVDDQLWEVSSTADTHTSSDGVHANGATMCVSKNHEVSISKSRSAVSQGDKRRVVPDPCCTAVACQVFHKCRDRVFRQERAESALEGVQECADSASPGPQKPPLPPLPELPRPSDSTEPDLTTPSQPEPESEQWSDAYESEPELVPKQWLEDKYLVQSALQTSAQAPSLPEPLEVRLATPPPQHTLQWLHPCTDIEQRVQIIIRE